MEKVSVDFDDILLPFNQGFAAFHNRTYGTTRTYDELFSYNMPRVWNCTEATIVERVKQFYASPDHAALVPFDDALAGVRALSKTHELEIVTSRPDSTR